MLKTSRRIGRGVFPTTKPDLFLSGKFFNLSIYKLGSISKFSFSVSKKISKSAVLRNKLRRLGYGAVQELLKDVKPGFLVRFSITTLAKSVKETEQMKDEVKILLNKAGVLI